MAFKRIISLLAAAVLAGSAVAQNKVGPNGELIGERWVGGMGVTETVEEMVARDAASEGIRFSIVKVEKESPIVKAQRPGAPNVASFPYAKPLGKGYGGPYAPQTIGTNFEGVGVGESGFEPPDSNGAVGPNHVVVAVNGRIKAFSRTGVLGTLNMTTDAFFATTRNGSGISDPEVRWDPTSNRWFLIAINVNYASNRIVISRSNTTDPNGAWTHFFIQQENVAPAGNTDQLADYPSLGVDANSLYIGANMFSQTTGYQGSSAFVINKASILGAGPIVASAFRNITGGTSAGPFAPRGVDNWNAGATEGYFIGVDVAVFSRLQIRRVTYPGGVPTMSANIPMNVATTANPIATPQTGGTLSSLDDRLFAARLVRNTITGVDSIWTSHNIGVTNTGVAGNTRNGMRWYNIGNLTTTPTMIQSGTLFDSAASNPFSYWVGSITGTGQGHAVIGSSRSSANTFASAATAGRLRTDTLGTLQAPLLIFAGTSTYSGSRWGDYSETVVDPNDNMTVWTFQEYSSSSWKVRATQLRAPAPAAVTSLTPNTIAQGQTTNIVVNGTSTAGTEFYDPGAAFPNRLAAAFSGTGLTVNSVTFTSPTQFTINVTASGVATTGLRNLTVTNPDGQQSTGNNVITVTSSNNPVPTITSLVPNTRQAGLGGFTLTVNGTNFVSTSVVRWNGSDRTTSFVNSGQVTATINAADVAVSGSANVSVFNPAPGGGVSGTLPFTITTGSPVNVAATSITTTIGEEFTGGLAEILSSNNAYYQSFNDPISLICEMTIISTGAPAVGTSPAISFSVEANVARFGLSQTLEFFNFNTSSWENVGGITATVTDTTQSANITVNAGRFISGGQVRARVRWDVINDEDPSQDGWLHSIDRAAWTVSP